MKWIMQRIPYVILGMLALSLIPISHLDTYGSNQSYAKPSYELDYRQKRDFGFKLIESLAPDPCSKYEHGNAEDYVDCIKHEDHISQSYMKAAAWWQLLATVLGLLLIWRTLIHSKEASLAAKDASLAAWKTVSSTQKSSTRQLRPYLGIVSCRATSFETDKPISIEVKVKNDGQTPAISANVQCSIEYDTPDEHIPCTGVSQGRRINPNQTRNYYPQSDFHPSNEDRQLLANGEKQILIRVSISYSDFDGVRHSYVAVLKSKPECFRPFQEHQMSFVIENEASSQDT